MPTKLCAVCSKEFFLKPYRMQKALYCSRVCYGVAERGIMPKSAFKKGHLATTSSFKSGNEHPYYGKSSPALGKRWKWTSESTQKASKKQKGVAKPHLQGHKHWNWQGGITVEQKRRRNALEYKLWREAVFTRDDFVCQICKKRGGELQADHIKPFAYYPELRLSIDNGRTLCVQCHRQTDTFSGRVHRHKPVK